jgi:hypothetical protein
MTRLLAGLTLFLEKFELDLTRSHELDVVERPSVVELVLNSMKLKKFWPKMFRDKLYVKSVKRPKNFQKLQKSAESN